MKKLLDTIVRGMDLLVQRTDDSLVKNMLADDRIHCGSCTEAHCCLQATLIFLPEALYIADKYPVPFTLHTEWTAAGVAMEQSRRDDYFETNTPCVYLDDDKRCRIYDRRPSCCRTYFTACNPANCSPEYKETIPVLDVKAFDQYWAEGMIRANLDLGVTPAAIATLPRMVVIATQLLEDPSQQFLQRQTWFDFDGPLATS